MENIEFTVKDGTNKSRDVTVYALSTCGFCKACLKFLDDNSESERETGIKSGFEFLKVCDEIWVYTKNGISEGMQREIKFATDNHIDIKFDPWD